MVGQILKHGRADTHDALASPRVHRAWKFDEIFTQGVVWDINSFGECRLHGNRGINR